MATGIALTKAQAATRMGNLVVMAPEVSERDWQLAAVLTECSRLQRMQDDPETRWLTSYIGIVRERMLEGARREGIL